MALSWNEIKDRALNFSKEWADTANEEADAKQFLVAFFNVFGISSKRVSTFEHRVKKLDEKDGYIDLLWKGTILIEMKSRGKNLDKAFQQAKDYTYGLKEHELPKYILVSDFENLRLYDLEEDKTIEFKLNELINNVQHFGYILGYQKKIYKEQDPANIKAAELMGKLHDRLKDIGYTGHPLEVYLVRILFLLFAEDTTIFNKQQFQEFIEQRTNEDGSDLASKLQELFQVLNTPKENRFKNLDEQLNDFPYVNGKLFEENLPTASFDTKMRQALLECCYIDWSKISPAIFGSMFQSVMNPKERRNLGAHYTSEINILKLIKPLFLDELWKEFESIKDNKNKLPEFHKKLSNLKFLDPACGCGNFLVITYRELRLLEIEILRALNKTGQAVIDVREIIWLDVDMMYGIEYEEFPARIAEVAMWLIDHQMNMQISNEFGQYFVRLPLNKSAKIVHGNALQIDWNTLINLNQDITTNNSSNSSFESNTKNSSKSPFERSTENTLNSSNSSKSPLERGFRGVSLNVSSNISDNPSGVSPKTVLSSGLSSSKPPTNTERRIIIHYNPILKEYSRNLRNNSTKSEIHLWSLIKGKYNNKYDFHRQKPLLEFIADFFCYELKLVIELDGITHDNAEQIEKDLIKDIELNNLGINVLRFTDNEVLNHTDYVINVLNEYIQCFEKNTWLDFDIHSNHLNKLSKNSPNYVLVSGINNPNFVDNSQELGDSAQIEGDTAQIEGDTPLNQGDTPLNPLSRGDFEEFSGLGSRGDFKNFDYIMGNPPFIGAKIMTQSQRDSVINEFGNTAGGGTLDYVTAWCIKAAKFIQGTKIKVAFVSTNSIVQGEQVGILWSQMLNKYKIKIHFAHRTFKWSNEAKGNAAVYCIIIGFANYDVTEKRIFVYEDIKGKAQEIKAKNINPYLIDAKDILIGKRRNTICKVPKIVFGNMPNDGGNLLLTDDEKQLLIQKEPLSEKYIKPIISAFEFLNGKKRWCLWLLDAEPNKIKAMPEVLKKVNAVKSYRLASSRLSTQKLAQFPTMFGEIRQPSGKYILIPRVSSENRKYIPMGFFDDTIIVSDTCLSVNSTANTYHFGILMSIMHMAWVKSVCGRLESRFRYSNEIVYNNYPWPENPTEKQIKTIEEKAQKVLDARLLFPNSSLADLYDPLTMPPALVKAHNELDKAVDLAYRSQPFTSEANRMEFLFDLYEKYTADLFTKVKPKRSKKNKI